MTTGNPGNTIGQMVAALPNGPWYTMTEAAEKIGRSRDTLARWKRDETFVPRTVMFGELPVAVYNDGDIAALRRIAALKRPGPHTGPHALPGA